MAWLVIGSASFIGLSYDIAFRALDFSEEWKYFVPRTVFMLTSILALVLGLAVGVMLMWQLKLIMKAESTVENQDFARYRELAQSRGEEFINTYDLGRWKNLALFFNIGSNGYPWYTLLLPVRCVPYNDGWSWARKPGYDKHPGLQDEDVFTDEDED
jgi:palmitoyltransferase